MKEGIQNSHLNNVKGRIPKMKKIDSLFRIFFMKLFSLNYHFEMSYKFSGKKLTQNIAKSKSKCENIDQIKNLNLWGSDLENVRLLQKMPNLEVLCLSVNRISTLRDFCNCTKLQELFLRKNNIGDIREIQYLTNLKNLKVLWLYDNPCAQHENYRQVVIKHLKSLVKLDNLQISPEERSQSQKVSMSLGEIDRFRGRIQVNEEEVDENEQKYPRSYPLLPKKPFSPKLIPSLKHTPVEETNIEDILVPMRASSPKRNMEKVFSFSPQKCSEESPSQKKNSHILSAILSLIHELDLDTLQLLKTQIESRISA